MQIVKGVTKLYFTRYSCVVIILLIVGLRKSPFFICSFGKLVFLSLCALFSVLFQIRCNLVKLCNIFIIIVCIYVTGALCFLSHLLETICKSKYPYKNFITVVNKSNTSRWLLSWIAFGCGIYKEKWEHSQNERVKKNVISKENLLKSDSRL